MSSICKSTNQMPNKSKSTNRMPDKFDVHPGTPSPPTFKDSPIEIESPYPVSDATLPGQAVKTIEVSKWMTPDTEMFKASGSVRPRADP